MKLADTQLTQLEARLVGKGSPFELVHEPDGNAVTRIRFKYGPKSLIEIWRKAALASKQVCISDGTSELTNGDLFDEARALAVSLRKRFGAGIDTRVAVVLRNRPEWPLAFVAVTMTGASVAAIHASRDPASILGCITDANCALAIVEFDIAEALHELGLAIPMLVVGSASSARQLPAAAFSLGELLTPAGSEAATLDADCLDAEKEALIAFTSGSTSRPKGVVISHRSLVAGMMNAMLAGALSSMRRPRGEQPQFGGVPVSLAIAPFSHVAGYIHFLSMLHVGGRIVTRPELDAGAAADLIASQRVSSIVGAPPELVRDLLANDGASRGLQSLRTIGLNGVRAPAQLLADLAAVLPHVSVGIGYGLTETSGLISSGTTHDADHEPLSSGRCIPTAAVRVVGPDGKSVATNEIGEIWVSGAMLADRYLGGTDAHRTAFEDGWFKTGDAGLLDARGNLFAKGRMGQQISYGGSSVSCMELEHLVLEDRQIREAVAMDLPLRPDHQRIAIAVVPRTGAHVNTAAMQLRLSPIVRKEDLMIVMLPSLPRTATGKIELTRLRGLVSEVATRESAASGSRRIE